MPAMGKLKNPPMRPFANGCVMLKVDKKCDSARMLAIQPRTGTGVRHEKAASLLRLALKMQGTRVGVSYNDIQYDFEVSRRGAERMRDAVERVFPQMELANPGELPKRWRIPSGTLDRLANVSAEELAELQNAISILRRDNLVEQAALLEGMSEKLSSIMKPEAMRRVAPDLEALLEAEGLATRPGPRPNVMEGVLGNLREAILACRKIRLHYRSRTTDKRSRQIVCPYGFLYGNRHYLVAFSMNPEIRDYRLFSLSNIDKAEIMEWPFERREDFSLVEYAKRSFGVFQEEPFDVAWKFTPEAAHDAREFRFHPSQTMEEQPDGSLIVRFRASGALEMSWHLFTWGDGVEVLEPKGFWERI